MADGNITPLFTKPHLVHSGLSPVERVRRAHKIVEAAAKELDSGQPGSGVTLLLHAAGTHLALTHHYAGAAVVVDGVARSLRAHPANPEPAA